MGENKIRWLLKFAPKEAYIDDLMSGRLYMNAAGYYHGMPGEQGDPLEASIAPGVCAYCYTQLPIYCMYTICEGEVIDDAVMIPGRMISEFGCENGWIGVVRYDRFARLIDDCVDGDKGIFDHGSVSYGTPSIKLTREILQGIPHNLFIKTPKYAYQREYRILGANPADFQLKPKEGNPDRMIEVYGHEELDLGRKLADFSWKVPVADLKTRRGDLALPLPAS